MKNTRRTRTQSRTVNSFLRIASDCGLWLLRHPVSSGRASLRVPIILEHLSAPKRVFSFSCILGNSALVRRAIYQCFLCGDFFWCANDFMLCTSILLLMPATVSYVDRKSCRPPHLWSVVAQRTSFSYLPRQCRCCAKPHLNDRIRHPFLQLFIATTIPVAATTPRSVYSLLLNIRTTRCPWAGSTPCPFDSHR